MSCTLDLSSVITCKKATTSGIFSIRVGYCDTVWPWNLNGQSQDHKSGNKIWEDPLRTNLNAKVYLHVHVIYCENIK